MFDLYDFLISLRQYLSFPAAILFLVAAVFFTIKTRFIQIRAFKKFLSLISSGLDKEGDNNAKTISPFHALFTSMSTTIGMGNIVAPPIAIVLGGPGALFWLVVYNLMASATKYAEVVFAVNFRSKTKEGYIVGGPTEYLKKFSVFVGNGYGFITIFLFAGWSALQANTLGEIFCDNGIPTWITGLVLALFIFSVLIGGAKRVGSISSKLVPAMFVVYAVCSFFILFKQPGLLVGGVSLIFDNIFTSAAPIGGFLGASLYVAIREGISKGVFITECGIGTSSVAHSIADVKRPTDQGVLALYSVAADIFLCLISGMLVIVTGVWESGEFSNMLMFKVFDSTFPGIGYLVLFITLFLFVLTTLIGNSFNGGQSFASFTKHKYMTLYYVYISVAIFFGAIVRVPLMWAITDIMVIVISIPNLIGLVYLSFRYSSILRFKGK